MSKTPGVVFILLATKSVTEFTEVAYNNDFVCSQKKKFEGFRCSERGGQAIGPPRRINLEIYVSFRKRWIAEVKCVGNPSDINHISLYVMSGTASNK
ncbi:hypothetical protein AVEN_191177-1 [Araneus ventricosus]|uniref:Uncharacterized protein n=1 Tax=Araneus ventricosus TaxID=182803 RepID=A0A4Y2AZW0_ARAVE|nr:hypothetical protein AVEN_191177-1 [Araneus ventricosus]